MLYVPEVYPDYCSESMMVMERIYGIPVSDVEALEARAPICSCWRSGACRSSSPGVPRQLLPCRYASGNIFVSYEHPEDPQYIGIDCGIVGSLNKEDKRYLAENFIAFSTAIIVKLPSCTSIPVGFRPIPTLKSLSSRSARSASRS